MITPEDICAKLRRRYHDFLRVWLRDETILPLDLPVGKRPDEWSTFKAEVERLLGASKEHRRYGYRVETEIRQSKRLGKQAFPVRIWIDTEDDFLALIGKREEFSGFQQDISLIRAHLPQLEGWIEAHPQRVIDHHGKWEKLLEICVYFLNHPQPDLYIRELPINAHSKFIEQHTGILRILLDFLLPDESIILTETRFTRRYGLREDTSLVRLRLLDNQLKRRYGLGLTDLSVPLPDLNILDLTGERGIIVENLTTFLTLPAFPSTFAIFGKGFDAVRLGQVDWLRQSPLIYWGDLDAQGFQILALLRRGLPDIRAVMMDQVTFEAFADYAVTGTSTKIHDLPELTNEEAAFYRWLAERNLRLEQERIPYTYALEHLKILHST